MRVTDLAHATTLRLADEGCSPKTLEEYERIYGQYVEYLHSYAGLTDDVRHFTAESCQGWVRALRERGFKLSTIRQKLSALSALAKTGLRTKGPRHEPVLRENPLAQFTWPKRQRPKQEFLFPDELRAFLAVVPRWPAEGIARDLLVDTGLRVSELCRANVDDFIPIGDGYVLYVTVKGEGRQDERVPCPISTPVGIAVTEYLRSRPIPLTRRNESAPLLANTIGERYRRLALGDVVRRLGRQAGIKRITVSPHKLRRTSNVLARFADVDSLTRSRLLNHLDPGTIRQYDALIPGELAKAREQTRLVGLAKYLGVEPIVSEDSVRRASDVSAESA